MNLIDVNERLPIQMNYEEEVENEWVPVTDGVSRWAIAKCKYDHKKNEFVWRFWEGDRTTFCPAHRYEVSRMAAHEIKYWVDIWKMIFEKEKENE